MFRRALAMGQGPARAGLSAGRKAAAVVARRAAVAAAKQANARKLLPGTLQTTHDTVMIIKELVGLTARETIDSRLSALATKEDVNANFNVLQREMKALRVEISAEMKSSRENTDTRFNAVLAEIKTDRENVNMR